MRRFIILAMLLILCTSQVFADGSALKGNNTRLPFLYVSGTIRCATLNAALINLSNMVIEDSLVIESGSNKVYIAPDSSDFNNIINISSAGFVNIGSASASSVSASGEVAFGGNTEFLGTIYPRGNIFGRTTGQSTFGYYIMPLAGQQLSLLLNSGANQTNNVLVLGDIDFGYDKNYDHGAQSNPLFAIHTDDDPDVSNNYWGGFQHDNTGLTIQTGANTGAGSAPATIDNYISLQPRGTEQFQLEGDGDLVLFGGTADKDFTITLNGETNDGVLTWHEDEDSLSIACDLGVSGEIRGSTHILSGNSGNASHTFITLTNTDEPASGETSQTADIVFKVMGTTDDGSSFAAHEVGKISGRKIDDFFHATTEEDHEGGISVWGVDNGAYAEAFYTLGSATYFEGKVRFKANDVRMYDNCGVYFGTNASNALVLEGADPNAHTVQFQLGEGDAYGVPVLILGDRSINNVNLGLFDGITEPRFEVFDDDADSHVGIGFYGDDEPGITTDNDDFTIDTGTGVLAVNDMKVLTYRDDDIDDNDSFNLPDGAVGHGVVYIGNDTNEEGATFAIYDDNVVLIANTANCQEADADNKLVIMDGGDTVTIKNTLGDDYKLTLTLWYYVP